MEVQYTLPQDLIIAISRADGDAITAILLRKIIKVATSRAEKYVMRERAKLSLK